MLSERDGVGDGKVDLLLWRGTHAVRPEAGHDGM